MQHLGILTAAVLAAGCTPTTPADDSDTLLPQHDTKRAG